MGARLEFHPDSSNGKGGHSAASGGAKGSEHISHHGVSTSRATSSGHQSHESEPLSSGVPLSKATKGAEVAHLTPGHTGPSQGKAEHVFREEKMVLIRIFEQQYGLGMTIKYLDPKSALIKFGTIKKMTAGTIKLYARLQGRIVFDGLGSARTRDARHG